MLNLLLKGVYDQGIRDWIRVKYNQYRKENAEVEAYQLTVNEANKMWGKWHVR